MVAAGGEIRSWGMRRSPFLPVTITTASKAARPTHISLGCTAMYFRLAPKMVRGYSLHRAAAGTGFTFIAGMVVS